MALRDVAGAPVASVWGEAKTIRIGDDLGKGYVQEEMLETFRRYIPKAELEAFMAEMRERSVASPVAYAKPRAPRGVVRHMVNWCRRLL